MALFALGRCRFGDKCKFSHDQAPGQQPSSSRTPSHRPQAATDTDDELLQWKYKVPKDAKAVQRSRPLGSAGIAAFFQQALELVQSSEEKMQQVIQVLCNDGGLYRVKELLDQQFDSFSDDKLQIVWTTQLVPFFQLLSHETVLMSLMAEENHATLINTLYSLDGNRAVQVFRSAFRFLTSEAAVGDEVESCITVLAHVFQRKSSAKVNPDFTAVVEAILSLSGKANPSRSLERNLITIRTALGIEIPELPPHLAPVTSAVRPTFTIAQDLPGELSEDGPRHDNDSADITEIEILPTMDEILQSSRPEYLPRDDPSEWHLPGIAGLIDRQFRLLREDSIGQLRDAAKFELERLQNPQEPKVQNKDRQGARTNVYQDVCFENVIHDEQKGMLFVLAFQQPRHLQRVKNSEREQWWNDSKRLAHDSLICLLSSNGDATFLVVHSPAFSDKKKPSTAFHKQYNLASSQDYGYVVAQLTTMDGEDTSSFLRRCLSTRSDQLCHSLIEFPGVALPAFESTLLALQQMSESLDVPFADLLLPNAAPDPKVPAYASAPGFRWRLQSIVNDSDPASVTTDDLEAALEDSTLDEAQQKAIVHALTNQLALIQGPPGTGKSFTGIKLIQALLNNKTAAKLGPIVCVCYTNHALDQLLEHLVDAGIGNVIRIGSRSKSERLADINLRNVAQKADQTKTERQDFRKARGAMKKFSKEIGQQLKRLSSINAEDGEAVSEFLRENHYRLYEKIFQEADEDGFQTVDYHHRRASPLHDWLHGNAPALPPVGTRSLEELQSGRVEPHLMSSGERQGLHDWWVEKISEESFNQLQMLLYAHKSEKEHTDSIRGELDLRILAKANVIGITTTGLARSVKHLRKLPSKVLVVEEAGEVLEAHLLTALLPSLESVVQIGDHQQLRPKVQNYDLSVENPRGSISLDVSLFERLISKSSGLPFVTLETQRRMHPSVSELIHSTLYPNLQDAESVHVYPEVIGMRRRLFWMDHDHPEDAAIDQMHSTSHINSYEVDMVAALVYHLVRQGVYRAEDIAVLTPYLGQLRKLKRKLSSFFTILLNDRDVADLERDGDEEEAGESESVGQSMPSDIAKGTLLQALRVASVDNFQGEESKVVVISLVRSNEQKKCGFLRTSNRINVLLSRAMHGMYIIGSSRTCEHVQMWNQVLEIFKANDNIGPALELCCPRHPETALQITEPDQFAQVSPEAGCSMLCASMLPCGHSCPSPCHAESLHNATFCAKNCTRPKKGCSHPCERRCGEKCDERCHVLVEDIDVQLACGHRVTELQCWQYQDPTLVTCMEPVKHTVLGCEHEIGLPCFQSATDPEFQCREVCGALLDCGHQCKTNCNVCRPREDGQVVDADVDHGYCTSICGRSYNSCSHSCGAPCHGDEPCGLCKQRCESSCVHSACAKKCSEPCTPCAEEACSSRCPHASCSRPCSAPCDWIPCNIRCEKVLDCGHRCPSMCGEVCPSPALCQTCGSNAVKDMTVDLLTMQTYGEIDLNEEPCITLDCGHIFTIESLDGMMELSAHYEVDPTTGSPTAMKNEMLPLSYDKPKTCPNCRGSMRRVSRYGRIVRRSLLDVSTIKFIAWSNSTYVPLAAQLQKEQANLQASSTSARLPPGEIHLGGPVNFRQVLRSSRYKSILKLGSEMFNFSKKVASEEQPFQRVRDLVEAARRRGSANTSTHGTDQSSMPEFNFDQTILQTRGQLLAQALLHRTELIIITDVVSVWENMPAEARSKTILVFKFADQRKLCDTLLANAQTSKNVLQQAEALIFWAHYAALECSVSMGENTADIERLKREAHSKVDEAQAVCNQFPGQTSSVSDEVEGVRQMLSDNPISAAEMHMVVAAMATEFSGTGHWYRCVNGHPFTIGECGGPIQMSRCPQCGATIGGHDHMAAEGVVAAHDIERDFGNLRV